eukprot:1156806-Pelagomonas_calceolata.AAC.2
MFKKSLPCDKPAESKPSMQGPHAPLLCAGCRLDRLQYLTSTLRDGGIKWHVALTMPEADWLDMYSGYKKWWAARARCTASGGASPNLPVHCTGLVTTVNWLAAAPLVFVISSGWKLVGTPLLLLLLKRHVSQSRANPQTLVERKGKNNKFH